ncbi:hypothetical protein GCM10020001_010290 [Nonomuraea salmonea]
MDVTQGLERGVRSLTEHRTYIEALQPGTDPEKYARDFLEGSAHDEASRFGGAPAVSFRLYPPLRLLAKGARPEGTRQKHRPEGTRREHRPPLKSVSLPLRGRLRLRWGQTWMRRSTALTISAMASSIGTPFFCSPLR